MKIGFIGLGKMGKNMVLRLAKKHKVVAYNRSTQPIKEVMKKGATGAFTIEELFKKLPKQKIIWLMVPASVVEKMIEKILPYLSKNDIVIDGGNSNYHDTLKREKMFKKKQINFLDVGVSGGLVAAKTGYCIMVGGEQKIFNKLKPIFSDLTVKDGFVYTGPSGSGHYVKMVHNAIEYGIMQSIGEGFELLEQGHYKNLNLKDIASVWNNGSIIRSFLMELTENALKKDSRLKNVKGYIEDTGEGRWSIEEALKQNVPFNSIASSMFTRYRSRQKDPFSAKLIAALRNEFGGHKIRKK